MALSHRLDQLPHLLQQLRRHLLGQQVLQQRRQHLLQQLRQLAQQLRQHLMQRQLRQHRIKGQLRQHLMHLLGARSQEHVQVLSSLGPRRLQLRSWTQARAQASECTKSAALYLIQVSMRVDSCCPVLPFIFKFIQFGHQSVQFFVHSTDL